MTKTINRPKSATAMAVILAAALGGGCLHAKPVAESRPIGAGSAMYPTLGLRFTAQEDPPAPIAPARGGYWSRTWGWGVGGAAAAVAIAYGAYKGYKWLQKVPEQSATQEANTPEWRTERVDYWSQSLTEEQEKLCRVWATDNDEHIQGEGNVNRHTHEADLEYETKVRELAGDSPTLVTRLAPLYRTLLRSGAFTAAHVNQMRAGDANLIDQMWRDLPKNARAKDHYGDTTLAERVDDVRDFGNALNIMNAEDAGRVLDVMLPRLEDTSELTVEDRANLNQIIEQWGLYDQLLDMFEMGSFHTDTGINVDEMVNGIMGTGFDKLIGPLRSGETFFDGRVSREDYAEWLRGAVRHNNISMTLPEKARLVRHFAWSGAIFDPDTMINLESIGLGHFSDIFRNWTDPDYSLNNVAARTTKYDDNKHFDVNDDGVINMLDIPLITEQVYEAFEEHTGRPLTQDEFEDMTKLNGYAYRYSHRGR